MLKKTKDVIKYFSELALADLVYDAVRKNKYDCDTDRFKQAYKIYISLYSLQHALFEDDTDEDEVYYCLQQLTGGFDLNEIPTLRNPTKPDILLGGTGVTGPRGPKGTDGTNANITLQPEVGETRINIREELSSNGQIKDYFLSYEEGPFIEPNYTITLPDGDYYPRGEVVASIPVQFTGTWGAGTPTVASGISPVVFAIGNNVTGNFALSNLSDDFDVIIQINNYGEDYFFNKQGFFVYPILQGSTISETPTYYSELNRIIRPKEDTTVLFNGTDEYFFFGYPASYGDLKPAGQGGIIDQNGLDVTNAFEEVVTNITSTGLDNNWTVQYRIYKTIVPTTINGNFTFNFQ